MAAAPPANPPTTLVAPSLLIGFALGGFFDGILLHQILQWHHLLSGVQVEALQDVRTQMLADGLFHLLMYAVAALGLWRLWRARAALAVPGAARVLPAWGLAGFGGWHVVDAVVSHWLTGIHRIRMDSPNPLAWDLAWLAAFGLVPLALGWWWARWRPAGGRSGGGGARGLAAAMAATALAAGWVAGQPPAQGQDVVVVFAPGVTPAQALGALGHIDGRVVWSDRAGAVWAVRSERAAEAATLYRHGALLVSRSALGLGCLAWSRASGSA